MTAPDSTNLLKKKKEKRKKRRAKNLHMNFAFFVVKANNLVKKLPLPQLLTVYCPKWTQRKAPAKTQ